MIAFHLDLGRDAHVTIPCRSRRGLGGEGGSPLKPHPDVLQRALAGLGAARQESLYVGDMHVDLETARAAGVAFVGVATGVESASALRAAGAEVVLEGIGELLAYLSPRRSFPEGKCFR